MGHWDARQFLHQESPTAADGKQGHRPKPDSRMSFFRAALRRYNDLCTTHGYKTGVATAAFITLAGDCTCQAMTGDGPFDVQRAFSITTVGALYTGIVARGIYLQYDKVFGFGHTAAIKKTMVETVLHTPFVYIPTFYLATNLLKGKTVEDARQDINTKWVETVTFETCLWLPGQAINFALVPVPMRVLYISTLAFFEKAILSFLANKEEGNQPDPAPKAETL